jgi:hypothetical protein
MQSPGSVNCTNSGSNLKVVNVQSSNDPNRVNNMNNINSHGNNFNFDPSNYQQIVRHDTFQKQKNLKRVLKEFGLQQYLRVFSIKNNESINVIFRNFMNWDMMIRISINLRKFLIKNMKIF